MEDAILTKRRHILEEGVLKEKYNYDLWFDYTRLEEQSGDIQRTEEIYERAIACQPPVVRKQEWSRYIYLWYNYAIFEEEVGQNMQKAEQIYEMILKMIPHEQFTFSKLWILYTQFLIRQKNLDKARKMFGQAIGRCPRPKIFKAYADLELQLGEVDRCRQIYEKQLKTFPEDSNSWIQYADFESSLDEFERARQIFEIATEKQNLDMPENAWKAYIDFEISQQNL